MAHPFSSRSIGTCPDGAGAHARVVERVVLHGAPMDPRALLACVVTERTRYLVLDLDRTLHFGRNMGELLGWELPAVRCYGAAHVARIGPTRSPGRFLLDPARPLALLHYLVRGAAAWAYPGLFYLLWGKLAPHLGAVARHRYRRFGEEPQRLVQSVPAVAMLHELASVPLDTARELARDVFRRHADDLVLERADLDWLRALRPELVVILSSASPQPVVEAAAQELGIDAVEFTELELRGGYLSSPHRLHPLYLAPRLPRRICPPDAFRINAGHAKIASLVARFPDFLDVETVGISDTSHGEDHPWAQYLTRVVDVNSPTPFPPLVAAGSPLREVHSAQILTRRERGSAAADPRRARLPASVPAEVTLGRAELEGRLGDLAAELETLGGRYQEEAARLADVRREVDERAAAIAVRIGEVVAGYNAAEGAPRRRQRDELSGGLRREARAAREARRLLRPLLDLRCAIDQRVAASRARLPVLARGRAQGGAPHLAARVQDEGAVAAVGVPKK